MRRQGSRSAVVRRRRGRVQRELEHVNRRTLKTKKSTFAPQVTHLLTRSLTHSFTHSLTHSPTHSPAHLLTHSLTHSTHSFVHLVALVPMQRVELRWKVNSQRVSWKVNSQRVSALRSFMGGRMTSVAPRVRPSKTW